MYTLKPKSYSILEVLNMSEIGLIFEFYTSKESKFIIENLSSRIGKNVILTGEENYIPSYSNALLIKEYDATKSRYQFHIAPQDYHTIIPIIDEVSNWISENCDTTNDTRLKMSLSFNHHHLDTISHISQMNPTKLLLKFDENFIYDRFPTQRNSPYAMSIKKLSSINNYINESEIESNIKYILSTPHADFYGINFSNYTNGILGCNYIGGEDYANNTKNIKDVLEYFIIKTYQSINENTLTDFESYEIKRLTEGFDKIQMSYYDPIVFLNEFKDIKLYVDLKTSTQTIKTFWNNIRKPIFEMILNGGLQKGILNYDTHTGKYQLKNGNINGANLNNIDLVLCELSGVFENCDFVKCNINKSRIINSNLIRTNNVNESYLNNVTANRSNHIQKSFVLNNEEIINCKLTESVIKFATPGRNIEMDNKSTVVIKPVGLPQISNALKVEEIRDYSWIKAMNKNEDKGFQNEYIKNNYIK